ncbi:fibronectin-binding autotransporter adhesin [Pseudomonas sp. IT-P176]
MNARQRMYVVCNLSPLSLAVRLGLAGLFFGLASPQATAACSPTSPSAGATVTCTGVPTLPLLLNTFSSSVDALTVNVTSGAGLNATLGGAALSLTGNNVTLNNAGTVDPAFAGLITQLSNGVVVGNATASTVNISNAGSGIFRGSAGVLGQALTSLDGMALNINNGAGGSTSISNSGTIDSSALLGLTLTGSDAPVVAVYGGSQVSMSNAGSIVGRVAFESSVGGNSFINTGTISGGVSMGANSTNTFTAVTGSSISNGGGAGLSLGAPVGINLTYAPTGQVDGGAGGNNNLILQNPIGSGGGASGVGTASSVNYINFNNLRLDSGTWTLEGPLVSGSSTLNGGVALFNNNATFGSGALTVNGGILQASSPGLNLSNPITLGINGAVLQGGNGVTLSGVIAGTGALVKSGNGDLTLDGINTFHGGTTLNVGNLILGSANALGTGVLTVEGTSSLDSTSALSLSNGLNLNAALTVAGSNNLTLSGVVAGTETLNKEGLADLTLSGANTFTGQFNVLGGSLSTLGSSALGSNAGVNLAAGSRLNLGSSASVASLTGSGYALISAGNTLSVGGGNQSSAFDGILTGTGELRKLGSGTLTLTGYNNLTGDTRIDSGTLNLTGSLASANVVVNSGATLTGFGTVGGIAGSVHVLDGGHLAVGSGLGLLTGSVVLGASSNLYVSLGTPEAGGGNALLNVNGNLTLDGTLNVSGFGGFGNGVYRLINYSGGLTDHGMLIGSVPGSVTPGDLQLQTAIGNQVNLLVSTPTVPVQFWDGGQLVSNGVIDGGSGTWASGSTNWTSVDGTLNQTWANGLAVFQGAAGTVTVNGAQNIVGLQFVTDGYSVLNGSEGSLNLINGTLGNALVRVEANATATLGVALNGAGTLGKYDFGTLVLNAANGYTGGTVFNGGKLVLGNNLALGTGMLTAANGATLDSNTAVSLDNNMLLNGSLYFAGSNPMTLNGVISGDGILIKTGAASLTLNGSNSYGASNLSGGTLILGSNAAIGSGILFVAGDGGTLDSTSTLQLANPIHLDAQLTLAGNQATTLSGTISRGASLVKNGNASLVLSGTNTYQGGTTLNGGSTSGDTRSLQGAILNNAALTFEQTSNGTYSGQLTGVGTLSKTGTGQLLLAGNNTFTGNTNVQAGGLRVDGVLNSANVIVANGAQIGGSGQLGGSVQLASGATLFGGDAASPLSIGTLALSSGTNLDFSLGAATSSTTVVDINADLILDGTLNVTDAGGFGAGVYQLFRYGGSLADNGLTFGSLPVSAADLILQTSLAHQVNLLVQGASAQVQFWNGGKTNADGTISGGSGVWGTGTNWTDPSGTQSQGSSNKFAVFGGQGGTVTVVGNQGFTGLQFLDPGYVLVAGAGGSLSPIHVSNGTLPVVRVNAGVTTVIDAPLIGSGGIEKRDAGTLLLTGANTYRGGTTVGGGTLAGNTTSLQGNILNNAQLAFMQTSNGRFNGVLTGTGNLIKQGTGTVLLTGNHPFSGTTSVQQGQLQVGDRSSPTTFAGPVTVANGAGLSGNGSVGTLVNHGLVQSGGSAGTLSVAGNFSNTADGALNLSVMVPTNTPLVVDGTATLGGGLQVSELAPYTGDTTYSLITAGGGVNGTFSSSHLPALAFIDTALLYGANQVSLALKRNQTSFADVAVTANQRSVAAALDAYVGDDNDAGNALHNQILNLDRASASSAFDSLSGEIHASTVSTLLEDSRYVRDAVNDRMRQPSCLGMDDPRNSLAPSENSLSGEGCQGEMVGWLRVLGSWGEMDGDSNTASLDRNVSGFMLGTDRQLDSQWRAGTAVGYTRSDLSASHRRSDATVNTTHLAAYTNAQFDALAVRLGAAYSWHKIETKRDVSVGSYNDRLKADYDADSAQVFGEVGYTVETAGIALEPFVSLAYVNYDSDTGKEKGGEARLSADASQDITFSTVGLRAGKRITLGNGSQITPRAALGWRHAYGDTQPEADLTFIDGGMPFTIQGVPIAEDSALVEAGLDYQFSSAGKLGIGYSGQLSHDNKDQAMTISFTLGF